MSESGRLLTSGFNYCSYCGFVYLNLLMPGAHYKVTKVTIYIYICMYVLYIYIYVSVISILTEIWVSYAQKGGKVYSWPNFLNFTLLVYLDSLLCTETIIECWSLTHTSIPSCLNSQKFWLIQIRPTRPRNFNIFW